MDGVMQIRITKKSGGASCAQCLDKQATAVDPDDQMTGSDIRVTCKCPFICTIKIESTANMHTVSCNNNNMTKTTIECGSDLAGAAGVLSIDKVNHKLCSSKNYTALLTDYTWRCEDPVVSLATSPACDLTTTTTTTPATTIAAGTTTTTGTNTANDITTAGYGADGYGADGAL
jgi:hypothetical protein